MRTKITAILTVFLLVANLAGGSGVFIQKQCVQKKAKCCCQPAQQNSDETLLGARLVLKHKCCCPGNATCQINQNQFPDVQPFLVTVKNNTEDSRGVLFSSTKTHTNIDTVTNNYFHNPLLLYQKSYLPLYIQHSSFII